MEQMEQFRRFGFLLLALTVTSCSRGKEPAESAKSPDTPLVASSGTTATSPSRLCSLFTPKEIKEFLGAPVGNGEQTGPMGSACQWAGSGGDEFAQIQLINGTHFWEKHTGAKGYAVLHGIGKEAFVASSLGGWEAGTVTDKAVVFVSINGGSSNPDSAVRFLRSTLDRLGIAYK